MSDNVLHLNSSNFDTTVAGAKPVLVDFWAPWCGPCRMMGPIIDELSAKYAGKVKFAKMNVDENRSVPSKYSIQSIPALMIFKNGEMVKNLVGARPKEELETHIRNLV